jgi:putative cell wall-binding protein
MSTPASAGVLVNATVRYAGTDRYDTANKVASVGSTVTTENRFVLVSGESFADGLAASSLAGALGAAVLLTPSATIPASVLGTLTAMSSTAVGTKFVVIVGGESAVSAASAAQLTALGYSVSRVSGADRYATADAVAAATKSNNSGTIGSFGGYRTAFLANGTNFADALSASGWAYDNKHPIFLTNGTTLSDGTKAAIAAAGVQQLIILGGESAVSASVATAAAAVSGVITTTRVAGADRFETATLLASTIASVDANRKVKAVLVSGTAFPDALAASQEAARLDASLIPVTMPMPAKVAAWFTANQATLTDIVTVGGTSAVSADAVAAAKAAATIAPLTATVKAIDGSNSVEVTFSGEVTEASAETFTSYTATKPSGATSNPTGATYTFTGGVSKVVLTFGAALTPGDVVRVVGDVVVNSIGLTVSTATTTVTADTSAPTATVVAYPGSASATKKIWVTYSSNVSAATIDTTGPSSDFAVTTPVLGGTPAVVTGCALFAGTTYTCDLSAAAALAAGDTVTLLAGAVTTAASTPVPNAAVSTVAAADAVAPVISSARYAPLTSTGGVAASRTDVGGTSVGKLTVKARSTGAAAGLAGNGWTVATVDGAAGAPSVSIVGKAITITADPTDLAEAVTTALNSNAAFSALFVAETAVAGALTGWSTDPAASLTGGLDVLVITVTFSEPLQAGGAANLTLSSGEPLALVTDIGSAAEQQAAGKLVVAAQVAAAPTAGITTITATNAFQDRAGNALSTSGTSHVVALFPAS